MDKGGLCDTCLDPGHCCRFISLAGGTFGANCETPEEVEALIAGHNETYLPPGTGPMPFRPLLKRSDGVWVFWCPNLDRETGRCNDYENRPFACSNYAAGSDPLCVHYWPAPADAP